MYLMGTSMPNKTEDKHVFRLFSPSHKKVPKFLVQKVTVLVWVLAALLGIPTLIAKVRK